jgi:uncharacterized protein involved in exopolysaccharide biosynthesis
VTTSPDLAAEQEVDFRRYGSLLARRWWLPAAGLVAGVIVGALLSLAGGSVWTASALISLGQPFSPTGSAPVTSFATNPRAVSEIIRSESALKEAAKAAGMHVGALRGNVSSGQVGLGAGAAARAAVPLIELTVQGQKPAKVEKAAAVLAQTVVDRTTTPYVGTKIRALTALVASLDHRIATQTTAVNALQAQASNHGLPPLDRLAIVTQLNGAAQLLGQLQEQQSTAKQQLALAQTVESATVVEQPSAVKTAARSRRTSMVVAGLIGLILGALAALAWDSLAPRFR